MTTIPPAVRALLLIRRGCVHITRADDDVVRARVLGFHGIYDVDYSQLTGWSCTCPAIVTGCSHELAVRRITLDNPLRLRWVAS